MAKARTRAAAHRAVLQILSLFGRPVRVTIFQRLANSPMTAGELGKELPITRSAVVQHLKRLEAAGLVEASTEGRRRVYRTRPAGLDPLRQWLGRFPGAADLNAS